MQRLTPLKVPWQVSPSTPFLRLLATESNGDQPTQLVFAAYFGLKAGRTTRQEVGFATAAKASNPHNIVSKSREESETDSLVKIEFQDGLWSRFSPAFSDREILNPKKFDFSLIPYSDPPSDVGTWLRDFQSLWLKAGNCPDPRAYIVESSAWIDELRLEGFKHFLVEGHDAYAEILARDWKWEEVRKLPQWW